MNMAELTGVTVGNYFLLECLGREGMIERYRARPTTRGGSDVILRLFRPPFPDPTAFQEHFASEVEKVWYCDHEHILPLLEFGSGEDLLFDVTEFRKDKTLEQVLELGEDEKYFRSTPYIVHLITQVCDALEYAHEQHIIHGNLQPSSLIIQPDQNVLLTNFGMKRRYQEGDPLVAQIEEGNAAYVAPEQVVGILTPASDIYAVGVLLFRLLTGHLPYDGESEGEIALKHANEPIPSLRQWRPDLSGAVELVVRSALAKSPEARFPSADALARALLEAIAADCPPVVSVKAQRRIEVHSRRRTSFTWNSALSLIAILLVLFGLIGTLNFFSTLPMHLEDIPPLSLLAHKHGSIVETKLSELPPGSASGGVTPSTLTPNENNPTPHIHITPIVKNTFTPTVGLTVIPTVNPTGFPIIPLIHNPFCTSGALKLDSSPNLQPLLQQVDAEYLNVCPNLAISLLADGSSESFNKLEQGLVDVAGSDLTANPGRNLTDHPIGAMLYAIIVSPDVGVNGLSTGEIQEIFDGHITNWAQVGGSNEAISIILPPIGASINDIFQSFVLSNIAENVDAVSINNDSPVIVAQSVVQTPGAISFVPLIVAQECEAGILSIDGVTPGIQSLLDGTYKFWSIEHLYTQNTSIGVQAYEGFLSSSQEEHVLSNFDIVPMNLLDQDVIILHGSGPES
jgi:serine/threonine protein kinase